MVLYKSIIIVIFTCITQEIFSDLRTHSADLMFILLSDSLNIMFVCYVLYPVV